jgi:fimbrial isopeptide formation D2 family protein
MTVLRVVQTNPPFVSWSTFLKTFFVSHTKNYARVRYETFLLRAERSVTRMALRTYIACFILFCCASVLAQTLGGTTIVNEATADYSVLGLDSSTTSNEVESVVPSFCTFSVTPDGTVATPAFAETALPGGTVYFPYTLVYTGNVVTDIDLTALVDAASTLVPSNVSVILDGDGDGVFDSGEPTITSLESVSFNSSTDLLLSATFTGNYESAGSLYINLQANCAGNTVYDNDNISRVDVLEGGVIGPFKTSTPISGTLVSAGGAISYDIGFTVNLRPLEDVVVTDVLDPSLATPTSLRVTVNGSERPGVASYDPTSRTVTASLGTLQPSDVVVLTIATNVLPGTPGAVTINNTARMTFTGGTLETETTTHVTPSTCAVVIEPNGNPSALAYEHMALPGETVVLPYTLTNYGNVTNDFLLETTLSNNAFTPEISLYLDANNNDRLDAGDVAVTRVDDVPPGETVNLLLVVAVPSNAALSGAALVNIIGRCALEPTIADDDNLSQVEVPGGGITRLLKSSEPIADTILYPGAALTYFITFTANGRDLSDVVVTDVLDERLETPSSFTNGQLRDEETGLTANVVGAYDAATRTLSWQLASVPAGMTVRLGIVTSVNADLQPQNEELISNTATFSSSDIAETPTNTITHPLNRLEILLQKTASPEQVFVGDTLNYTLTIINPEDSITLQELILTDDLPDELRYQPGTARVTLPGAEEEALEPTVDGQILTWRLPGLEPGEQIIVKIGTDVLAAAAQVEELLNTAEVVASDANGRAVADAAAEAATVVDKGLFTAPAVLLGTVFEDLNGNTLYDQDSDIPVSGVRLYLSDGRYVVSDELGRYTFLELRAGIDVVKVDATTLPARLLAVTKTEARPGLWRVRLEEGLITRQDVPLLPPGARVAVSQALNVVMGNVRIQKYVVQSETETRVVLEVSSTEALRGVVIQDVLPAGVSLSGEMVSDDMNMTFENLTFNLGDIASDYKATIYYDVQLPEGADTTTLLLPPTIAWSVRP